MKKLTVIIALMLALVFAACALTACNGKGGQSGGGSVDGPSSAESSPAESSSPADVSSPAEDSSDDLGIPPELVGTWVTADDSFVLTIDGDGYMAEGPNYSEYIYFYTYTVSDDLIYRSDTESGTHETLKFQLGEDVLTLIGEDGSAETYCRRAIIGDDNPLYGSWVAANGSDSINFWEIGSGGFVENGLSRSFSYCLRGDRVTIADGGINAYKFEIDGDTLTLYSAESGEAWREYKRGE
ncbi:MAG: hypothetical protein J5756_00880 [Clostridia bacterium]|nr:hypothetical protein [Clostridia bacterium]MBR5769696.1 hypothetical protein [Clostridia bacterium]